MMGEYDANTEGSVAGTSAFAGHSEFSTEQTGNTSSSGETGTSFGGSKLFADPGPASRGIDSGDGDSEARPKRGRPKGSVSKSSTKRGPTFLTGERLATARAKLTRTMGGVVGFSFSYYGAYRGGKYKRYSPDLAGRVASCYLIPKESAEDVGESLADTFITWFPQYVETTSKAIDPGLAIAKIYSLLQQTTENEKIIVERYRTQFEPPPPTPETSTNGHAPADPAMDTVEETINQWQPSAPTPEEIHPQSANRKSKVKTSSSE